jgi:hypothetical protein
MNILKKIKALVSSPAEISVQEAISLFKDTPVKYLTYRREPYNWETEGTINDRLSLGDLTVLVGRHKLAYIEGVEMKGQTACIRHIATALEKTRCGIAPTLARAYARELNKKFGITRIIFMENHSKYMESGYQEFFKQLGAKALPINPKEHKEDRPDYEWLIQNWDSQSN